MLEKNVKKHTLFLASFSLSALFFASLLEEELTPNGQNRNNNNEKTNADTDTCTEKR